MFKTPDILPAADKKNKNSDTEESTNSNLKSTNVCDSASKSGTVILPIPYTEPSWGGLPDVLYSLEELKSGVSLRTILLNDRSFHCFGRLNNCHIVMAHPSISRYHAILQFRSTFSPADEKKGFYIFDLSSTHGTFVNKERIPSKTFMKLQVGYIIKFGSSTRMFVLHGPEDDQEKESEYSYTQLREMKQKQLEERQKAYLEETAKLCKSEETGIDWGMGEDADEETDLSENPFAATNNEELYIDDPKKTLRGWFEREAEELTYNVEEKGFGQFRCTIELPIESNNGLPVIAEATVCGKKKEAVHQCALEACRILDRNGLLRQSVHESRQKKRKNWEEDDFYDSDEDNFFDRTGELETKRKQRMLQFGKEQPTADTHDSLLVKHANVVQQIKEIEGKLERISAIAKSSKQNNVDSDNSDNYMADFVYNQPLDKIEQRKLKVQLNNLKNDEIRLQKLVNFTKPRNLTQIKSTVYNEPAVSISAEEKCCPSIETNKQENVIASCSTESNKQEINVMEDVFKVPDIGLCSKSKKLNNKNAKKSLSSNVSKQSKEKDADATNDTKLSSNTEKEPNLDNLPQMQSFSEEQSQTKLLSRRPNVKRTNNDDYNNLIWKPPSGQTGDGRTSLNDKLGY